MTHNEMFGGALWISPSEECACPYLRKSFYIPEVEPATIKICGLGFFELYINGKKVSDDLLVPAYTQYEKRDMSPRYFLKDKLGSRIYVLEYDVTDYLKEGKNTLGIRLANGWYDRGDSILTYGKKKLCFKLSLSGLNIISDKTVKWKQSDITYSDIYEGERADCSLAVDGFSSPELDDKAWKSVVFVDAPDTEFEIQTAPADKVTRTLRPVLLSDNGKYCIYDAKEAVSGFASVKSLENGAEITVRYADALTENGELDFYPSGRIQQEIFKNTKAGEVYYPHFCWHGFRYIEVSDNAEIQKVNVVHSDCPVTSDFECDNAVLNWLYKAYIRTQLDNMHCGVPSDCPHIERHGYTGDGQLCCSAAMMMLDSKEFYRKWLKDIADCQDKSNGHVQHTAPFVGGGGGPAAWGGAIVVVPYTFYKMYGEEEIIKEYFPNMLKYVDYMVSCSENGLVYKEEEDWCLGDWCAPTEYLLPEKYYRSRLQIPETFVNTALFVKQMLMIKELAGIIGAEEKTAHLDKLIEASKHSLTVSYYSPMTKDFCGNVQGANGFACDIGLGGKDTVISTCEKYKKRGMFDTGILATDIIPRILFTNGYEQTAFDMLSSRGEISFGYMMEHGATTLWEDWHPERSLNHPMFGAATRYLFEYILGIRQRADSKAYEYVDIEPKIVDGLNKAKGHITTEKGVFSVSYEKNNGDIEFNITIPEASQARFIYKNNRMPLKAGNNIFVFRC